MVTVKAAPGSAAGRRDPRGKLLAITAYHLHGRLRRVGYTNLAMAMPELSAAERRVVVQGVFMNLGRLLGEFSQFPKITQQNVSEFVEYDGLENYSARQNAVEEF